MGFDAIIFKETPSEELICSICMGVFDDPVVDECDHVFCSECVSEWLRKKRTCPLSYQPCSPDKLKKAPFVLRNIIGSMQILCVQCRKGYVSLDQRQNGCAECYVRLLANRNSAADSFERRYAPRQATQSQSQSQSQAQSEDSDWLNWAGIATGVAVIGAGLLFLTSTKKRSRDS